MRSVTSFFNATLYKKNLTRFWPLWAAWFVLWLFVLPLNLLNQWNSYTSAAAATGELQYNTYRYYWNCLNLNGTMGEGGVIFGAVYAVLIVMAVYGYLFNHRSAATMHALPMRRENLFLTNYLSGLTFIVLPNAVVYFITILVELTTLPAELSAVTLPYLWTGFWMKTGCEFFFYTFAVFCAQFTGNILALPAFYGILNVLVVMMYYLVQAIGETIYYGGWVYEGEPVLVKALTPAYMMTEAANWDYISWNKLWNNVANVPLFGELELGFENPGVVAAYAAAGVVLTVLALLVYRRRHIETAGDVVSVKLLRPIFRLGVAVCAGLSGGILMAAFFSWASNETRLFISCLLCTVIGFYAAEMLLQKSFKVLKTGWKNCLVTVAVMAAALLCAFLDVFGVETWVPKADKVENVSVSINSTYPYDDGSYYSKVITDGVEVEKIIDLHQAIINDYEAHGESYFGENSAYIRMTYTLKDGSSRSRRYYMVNLVQDEINTPGTTTYILDQYLNDPAQIEYVYGLENARKGEVSYAELLNVVYPTGRYENIILKNGAEDIWEAVQADFAAGNLGQRYLFDDDVRNVETYYTDLCLYFQNIPGITGPSAGDYVEYADVEYAQTYASEWGFTVTLTPRAERTIAALEKYSDLGGAYELATHDVYDK